MSKQDTRIVYGATCTWWDSIDKVDKLPAGLPCCPHCKGVLFEFPDLAAFMSGAEEYERSGNPGYLEQLRWMRGKCFQNATLAKGAYIASKG